MSVSASIDVELNFKSNTSMLVVIQSLLNFGWSFDYEGSVFYLPVGDDDDFDWKRSDISTDVLLDIFRKKEQLGELIGVTMTWQETEIGGEFLFWHDASLSVNLSVNRKCVEEYGYTDINWYMEKIIPALKIDSIRVESFSFSEHV